MDENDVIQLTTVALSFISKYISVGKLSKKDSEDLRDTIFKLQGSSNELVKDNYRLQQENLDLQKKILEYERSDKEYDDWQQQINTHTLVSFGDHQHAIVPIEFIDNPNDAQIYYCPVCFEKKKKHPLHRSGDTGDYISYSCATSPNCRFKLKIPTGRPAYFAQAGR